MATRVKIDKAQLDYFRQQARSSPNLEIMAYLIGEVVSPTLTVVDSFEYTSAYRTQTSGEVSWTWPEYNRVYKKAEEQKKRIVGFIHTHPQWDAVLSPADYGVCISDGSRICGIVSVYDRKTRVRFWTIDSALPCEITYAKKTKRAEV